MSTVDVSGFSITADDSLIDHPHELPIMVDYFFGQVATVPFLSDCRIHLVTVLTLSPVARMLAAIVIAGVPHANDGSMFANNLRTVCTVCWTMHSLLDPTSMN